MRNKQQLENRLDSLKSEIKDMYLLEDCGKVVNTADINELLRHKHNIEININQENMREFGSAARHRRDIERVRRCK